MLDFLLWQFSSIWYHILLQPPKENDIYLISMWLILSWYIWFLVKLIVLWQSKNTTISSCCKPILLIKFLSQNASLINYLYLYHILCLFIIYFVSVVDKTIVMFPSNLWHVLKSKNTTRQRSSLIQISMIIWVNKPKDTRLDTTASIIE